MPHCLSSPRYMGTGDILLEVTLQKTKMLSGKAVILLSMLTTVYLLILR